MRVSACVTTRNRTKELDACLEALWSSKVKPHIVVVSDDSPEEKVQQANLQIVQKYPGTRYILGPRTGVCGNRNNAVNAIPESETDFVAFVDDDISVEPDFIALAIDRYNQMTSEERKYTILTGTSRHKNDDIGNQLLPAKLTFQGHFSPTKDIPQTVVIHAALFPRQFFTQEQWDENIFFGYEDAELCLRALKRGYKILYCSELKAKCIGENSILEVGTSGIGGLSNYELYIEAARLYIGIKRYKDLFPNPLNLLSFIILYFIQMTRYLLQRKAIQAWPEILRRSRIERLLLPSSI
ncbi:glycosyltransferase family 2 protein [Chlorogloeopsis sp. ULAP02]|uniref:glycosyltransferase family 2 protein n=1 Tax=Chlorogloeopsis sp. ULAP02 TaxID=3107926 RepID=UPI0031367567